MIKYFCYELQNHITLTGCGSAWLERLIWDQEVAGSNPVTPTFSRDVSSIFIINKIVRGLWYFFCLSIKRMYLFRYMRARKIKIKNCQEYAIKTLTDKNICNIISNCDSMVKNTSPIAPVGYLNNIFFRKYLIVGRLL